MCVKRWLLQVGLSWPELGPPCVFPGWAGTSGGGMCCWRCGCNCNSRALSAGGFCCASGWCGTWWSCVSAAWLPSARALWASSRGIPASTSIEGLGEDKLMLLRLNCTWSEGEPGNRGRQVPVLRGVRSFRDRCGLLVATPAPGKAGAIQAARA